MDVDGRRRGLLPLADAAKLLADLLLRRQLPRPAPHDQPPPLPAAQAPRAPLDLAPQVLRQRLTDAVALRRDRRPAPRRPRDGPRDVLRRRLRRPGERR